MILVMYSNFAPSARHIGRLAEFSRDMPVRVATSEAEALALAPDAEIILGHRYLRQALPHATRLRWVQSTAAGMDQIITVELRQRAPMLTRSAVASRTIALHALALSLALARRLPTCLARQGQGLLERPNDLLPLPRRAMVLGLGEIGRAVAALLHSLGMEVTGVALSSGPAKEQACDRLLVGNAWRAHLGTTDLLVACLPLTETTHGLVDAEVFAALPDHAVVVNVGRGANLDWRAASAALLSGRLGGLAVDAIDALPDPADPIWQSPNFLLTPKMAALQPDFQPDIEAYVEAQVRRYFLGEPLLNIVDYLDTRT